MSRPGRARWWLLGLAVLVVHLGFPGCGGQSSAPTPSPQPPPPSGPSVEEYEARLNAALDDLIAQTNRSPQSRIQFATNLVFAHEGFIEGFSAQVLELYVDALHEAGVHRIDIQTGLFPWWTGPLVRPGAALTRDETIAKYDVAIKAIKDRRIRLALNPQYLEFYHRVSSFDEWTQASREVYATLAKRYQPDVVILVHEPSTMATRMRLQPTVQQWVDFCRTTAEAVKAASPRTRVGAGGLASELEHFRAFAAMPELDVLTMNVFELASLRTNNDMVTVARESRKPIYIEETWRTPYVLPKPGDSLEYLSTRGLAYERFMPLDLKWIQAMAQYAGVLSLEAVTPFWSQTFFKYVSTDTPITAPAYNREVATAIENGERTDTFFLFQRLIRERGVVSLSSEEEVPNLTPREIQ